MTYIRSSNSTAPVMANHIIIEPLRSCLKGAKKTVRFASEIQVMEALPYSKTDGPITFERLNTSKGAPFSPQEFKMTSFYLGAKNHACTTLGSTSAPTAPPANHLRLHPHTSLPQHHRRFLSGQLSPVWRGMRAEKSLEKSLEKDKWHDLGKARRAAVARG